MAKRKNPASEAARIMGRLGGKAAAGKGGRAWLNSLTPEARRALGRKAIRARWAKTTAAQRSAFAKRIWRIRRKRKM